MKMAMNLKNIWLIVAVLLETMLWGQQPATKNAFVQAVVPLKPSCLDAVIDTTGHMTYQDSHAAVDNICGKTRRYLEDWLEDEGWELSGSATKRDVTVLNLELSGVTRQVQEIVSTAGRSYMTYFAMFVRVRLTRNGVSQCLDFTPRESFTSVAPDVPMTESIRMGLMKQGIDKLVKSLSNTVPQTVTPVVVQPGAGGLTVRQSGRVAAPSAGIVTQLNTRLAQAPGYYVQPSVRMVPGGQVVVPSTRVIYPGGKTP